MEHAHYQPPTATAYFDPSRYPKTYTYNTFFQLLMGGVSMLLLLATIAGMVWVPQPPLKVIIAAFCLPLAAYLLASLLKTRIVLGPESIELRHVFSSRTMQRADIVGRRRLQRKDQSSKRRMMLISRHSGEKRLMVDATVFRCDMDFTSWFDSLPDLDEQERQQSEAAILADHRYGATPHERKERLESAKGFAKSLTFVAGGVAAWAAFYPHPMGLAVFAAAVMPLVVLVFLAQSKGLFQLDQKTNDAHPSLFLAFLLPAMVLIVRSSIDFHLLLFTQPLWFAFAGGIFLCFIMVVVDSSFVQKISTVLVSLLMFIAYAWGVVVEADSQLDHYPTSIYTATVVGKHITSGKHRSYYVQLTPWGPRGDSESVSVNYTFYRAVNQGDQVCVDYHPGVLFIPWFTLDTCQVGGPTG